jgi:hypothetical protein
MSAPPTCASRDACVSSKPAKRLPGRLAGLPAAHSQEQGGVCCCVPALRFRADRSWFHSLLKRLPFPIANLRQIFAVLVDVVLVLDELVLHHLLQVGVGAEPTQTPNFVAASTSTPS